MYIIATISIGEDHLGMEHDVYIYACVHVKLYDYHNT